MLSGLAEEELKLGATHRACFLFHSWPHSLQGKLARTVALVTRPNHCCFCLFLGEGLGGISLLESSGCVMESARTVKGLLGGSQIQRPWFFS